MEVVIAYNKDDCLGTYECFVEKAILSASKFMFHGENRNSRNEIVNVLCIK